MIYLFNICIISIVYNICMNHHEVTELVCWQIVVPGTFKWRTSSYIMWIIIKLCTAARLRSSVTLLLGCEQTPQIGGNWVDIKVCQDHSINNCYHLPKNEQPCWNCRKHISCTIMYYQVFHGFFHPSLPETGGFSTSFCLLSNLSCSKVDGDDGCGTPRCPRCDGVHQLLMGIQLLNGLV